MKLIISNKPYSPWPMRVWLLMRELGLPFEEETIDLSQENKVAQLKAVSPTGRVPVLIDGDLRIWDSLAITEYLAEAFPDAGVWPSAKAERAIARSLIAETHSSWGTMRSRCIMNMRREPNPVDLSDAVMVDVNRIVEIWETYLARHDRDFLFRDFTAADANFAPVVSRFYSYGVPVSDRARAYMDVIRALPAYRDWREQSDHDPWFNAKTDAIY